MSEAFIAVCAVGSTVMFCKWRTLQLRSTEPAGEEFMDYVIFVLYFTEEKTEDRKFR